MSDDGTIALVSGPGYDLGDGLVRSFERIGDDWIEGDAYPAHFFFGDNFGWALAMDNAGTRAIITAPLEPITSPGLQLGAGGAYIYERDAKSGAWLQTHHWNSLNPGVNQNFGASCDISADGSVAVIGESTVIGTKNDGLADGVFVSTNSGGNWGPLIELVPTPSIPNHYNYGRTVSISDDGQLIAVGAPNAMPFTKESGIIVVFENQSGIWVQTDYLTRPTKGSFNFFGDVIEFDGHSLLAVDPSDMKGPNFEPGPAINIYERAGSSYPPGPTELMYQPVQSGAASIVVRNDTMMIGGGAGSVMQYDRDTDDNGVSWKFNSRYVGEPHDFIDTRYGDSFAFADDPAVLVVGEPGWAPDDFSWQHGRINFPNRVFTGSGFNVVPGTSSMFIDFDFPGLPLQSLFVELLGYFNLTYPQNCGDVPLPIQAVVEDFSLTPVQSEFELEGPLGSTITLSQVEISLAGISNTAPIDQFGSTVITGMTVQVDAMIQIGIFPAFPFSAQGDQTSIMPAQITGGFFGEPLGFSIPQLNLEFEPDLGLGANNPSITGTGSILTQENQVVCSADLTGDSILDIFDAFAFIEAFNSGDLSVDFFADGTLDVFDVFAFVEQFNAGCP